LSAGQESARTVRFGRLQAKGFLLGFSGARVAALAAALAVLVPALFFAGAAGAALVSPIVACLVAAAFVPVAGRPTIEWVPIASHWGLRRVLGQDVYGVRPMHPRPGGTLALPGDATALRVHVDHVTGAAMVHDPHRRTLTATAVLAHPAFVLLAPADQDRRIAAWGRVFAVLAATDQIAAVQVLEATIPDAGREVLTHWRQHGANDDRWAGRSYAELVEHAAPASSRHRTTITISLDLRRAAREVRNHGRGVAAAAAVLRQDMHTLTVALRSAELKLSSWLAPDQLATLVRAAYDPSVGERDETRPSGDLATAGPMGIHEHWDHFVADDNAHTAVLWISEWPRSEVPTTFLHPLILKAGVHKSFSLIARPVPARDAMRAIRRQKVDYVTDAEQKARIGQLQDFSDAQEYQDLLQRERELVAGHTDLLFTGFLAVTAPSRDDLDAAVADLQRAAIQCGCETRRLVGQQSQAFAAAALPLGRGL
jgi:hypothetical protein